MFQGEWDWMKGPRGIGSPPNPLEERLAKMDPSINQQAMDIGTQQAPLAAPIMGGIDKISPMIEYLLQMLSGGQQPQRGYTTSQQVGPSPYAGPRPNPGLKGAMMQPPVKQTY